MRIALLLLAVLAGSLCAADFSLAVSPHSLTLATGDRTYTLGDDATIKPLGLRANIAGHDASGKGLWLYPAVLQSTKVLRDDARVKAVRGVWTLTEGSPRYELELELQVHAGLPGLTVTSRLRRLAEGSGECYYFWGFSTPVTHHTAPGGPAEEFPRDEWFVLPRSSWVYLSQFKSGEGLGVISDGRVGRAPAGGEGMARGEVGGSPYLICTPRTATLARGETLDVGFTVLATRRAEEVAAVYRQLKSTLGDRVVFDSRQYPRAALVDTRPLKPVHTLQTGDGLSLSLTDDGRLARLSVGATSLAPPAGPRPLSGFFLRDCRARSPFTPFRGRVSRGGGGLAQTGSALNVGLSATLRAQANCLEIAGELHDATGGDRAVSVYYALPVRSDLSWQWGDSLETSRRTVVGEEYLAPPASPASLAGANGLNSLYPFASLSGPVGVALAVPLDQPRLCRLTYNPETQQYFVAFDLALTPLTKAFPSRASFRFSVYGFAPDWGFRAAAAKYYRLYPQCFEKRVKEDGGWVCWGNCKDVENVAELGYAYHWGLAGPEAVKWDNDHGLYALPYMEATNMHQTMEGAESTTPEDVVKRLQWMADPARTEPLPAWKYNHPYGGQLGDREAALRRSAAAYLTSLLYDREGRIYGRVNNTEFNLPVAKYVPCNANPALPRGIGDFFLSFWLPKTVASMESKGGHIDGIAMDNFHVGDTALGRRREQFPYETIPLTFETATGDPVLLKNFTTYEFTSELARRLRPQGRYLIANTCSATFPFTYNLLDIHGYEWHLESLAPFARTLAYHKPVCSLPVQDAHKDEAWIKWHLRYGFLPGGYANYQTLLNRPAMVRYGALARRLQSAGWEPVTAARSDAARVTLERFGTGKGSPLFFSVYNAEAEPHTATLSLDTKALGLTGATTVMDLTSGQPVACEAGKLKLQVAGKDVQVLEVK